MRRWHYDMWETGVVTFSSRISSAAKDTGRSIARTLRTCSKSVEVDMSVRYGMTRTLLTVLQNVANNSKFIEVTTSSLCTERLLESNLYVADRVLIPGRIHGHICKSED